MGVDGFAERAGREPRAIGETAPRRTVEAPAELTAQEAQEAQEAQVARMAGDGLSNPEIAIRLFVSPRTIQYHLRDVFTKLGIRSRSQLEIVLPSDPEPVSPRPAPLRSWCKYHWSFGKKDLSAERTVVPHDGLAGR
jgi:DNA-binding CsgD family transcriptional regulator